MEAPICALMDAMFRLPAKLDGLVRSHGHMLPRGAEDEMPLIKQDLEKMVAILQEHGNLRAEDSAMMVKCLVKEVRELSYDMEDSIDQYEHAAAGSWRGIVPRRKKRITRHGSKTTGLPEKLKWRLWIANKIREFSVRSQELLQRYSLFSLSSVSNTASTSTSRCDTSFGSWHPTSYRPVGIDAPMNKLEAWLAMDADQKLKVVSIVGSGGVGKTTLANELYHRIGKQYECQAFVRTSKNPDVRRLLVSMLSQVRPHQPPHNWKVHNLIADIRAHLQDKRYLIVIDDVWATSTWDIIHSALPDSNLCSGILITTEIEDVALKCCANDFKYVFKMKPLGDDDSSKLFFNTAFGPQHECPSELSEVSNSTIRKCGGLPLATVIVASFLLSRAGKPEQWDHVNKSLGYGLRKNTSTFEGMKQVLNLGYNNLPQHLKPCMLYLSIYKESYIIQKDDLVKQWIAEGFICATKERDKEEISRSYFDELINSRMIQPVHMNDKGDVLSCTVHHMVLDFIVHKSIEENFVITIDHSQTAAGFGHKVRRLSLQFGNAEATPPTNMRLSQVRTLAFFGRLKCVPSIAEFHLLQVLILHLWGDEEGISFDLTGISELFRLRYLHVTCNVTLEIQGTQIRGLQYLETLKIDARISAVPSNIVHLPGLLHLGLPVETNLPDGIGQMTSLCTLGYFDLSVNSIENVQSLGELTNLRDLQLTCSIFPCGYLESKIISMSSILPKLSNLKSLTLEPSSIMEVGPSNGSISCDGLSSISSPPALLQRFEWLPHICMFSSLPKWIGHLGELCILKIGVMKLARDDVDVLGGLPALVVLSLYVRTKPAERIVFNKAEFFVLKYFKFRCSVPWLKFEVDAMPNLQKLKLDFDAHGAGHHSTTILVGIEHLSNLKEISAKIGGTGGADEPDRRAAESALSHAIVIHPGRPSINIQCVDGMFGGKDDKKSGIQEEDSKKARNQYETMSEGIFQEGSRKDADIRVLEAQSKLDKVVADTETTLNHMGVGVETAQHMPETSSVISVPQVFGRDEERDLVIENLGVMIGRDNQRDQVISQLGVPLTRSRRSAGKRAALGTGVAPKSRGKRPKGESSRDGLAETNCTGHASILPIVGIGGVGKTTLAQYIYNDARVKTHFPMRIWVCASDHFDKIRITKEIIQSIPGEEFNSSCSLNALQVELMKRLMAQKFLLVLDDVWEKAIQEWDAFSAPLRQRLEGSMVLVTTRSLEVAEHIATAGTVQLKGLPQDKFRQLFDKCAFGSYEPESYPQLQGIGHNIADRLHGSPLAAKTLGRLLHMELTEQHWTSIQNSELWDLPHEEHEILPALQLSYLYLPQKLKRCFVICSMFPKDHSFERDYITRFWVAQGLVAPVRSMRLEDIACGYLDDLRSRSLFQTDPKFTGEIRYVMHDLIHDMAHFVSAGECFLMQDSSCHNQSIMPQVVRHMSVEVNNEGLSRMTCLNKLRSLRFGTGLEIEISWFNQLSNILYLSLKGCKLVQLPESICELNSLRYLDISYSSIQELPEKFWCLYRLQVFDASFTSLQTIHQGVTKLVNLRRLALPPRASQELSRISGLGSLSSLQNLSDFSVGKVNGRRISELKGMNQLSGMLVIRGIVHVQSMAEAAAASLVDKQYLKGLVLQWRGRSVSLRNGENEVLEALCPPSGIERLTIEKFGGDILPSWLKPEKLPTSSHLGLDSCAHFKQLVLPAAENRVESLRTCVDGTPGGSTGDDRTQHASINSNSHSFTSLTSLRIIFCTTLTNLDQFLSPSYMSSIKSISFWRCEGLSFHNFEGFLCLQDLHIHKCGMERCPREMSLPHSLQRLSICDSFKRDESFEPGCLQNLSSLIVLHLEGCRELKSVLLNLSNLNMLTSLILRRCDNLSSIGRADTLSSIQHVEIYRCPMLTEVQQPLLKKELASKEERNLRSFIFPADWH